MIVACNNNLKNMSSEGLLRYLGYKIVIQKFTENYGLKETQKVLLSVKQKNILGKILGL